MNLRCHIAIAVLISGATGCSRIDERYPLSEPACAIALGYMKRFKAEAERPIAVGTASAHLAPSRDEISAVLKEQPSLKRHPEVMQALAEADVREISVVKHCPEVRAWLSAQNISHDDLHIETATRTSKWPFAVLHVSAPVVSETGEFATFYASEDWEHVSGTVAVRYKRGGDGRWALEHESIVRIT